MDWIFLFLGSISFVEIFIRLNISSHINSSKDILVKVTHVVRSPRVSDHWKQKVLPLYSLMLLKQSILIFFILVASLIIFAILGLLSRLLGNQLIELTTSLIGMIAGSCFALFYSVLRSKINGTTNEYSFGSKILHHISLGLSFVGEALFDIEKLFYASQAPKVSTDRHVFVCGLARAGTTVLMRKLYESRQFCSLTYRDMPFVMAPNLWRKFNRRSWKNIREVKERAHGDGLMVDYDSPEALEEVFWKTHCGSDYIENDCLIPMSANSEVINNFRTYISLVLKDHHGKRYLSKNNNNILRLSSIIKAFPNATILIPFRQPEQQAYSLMNQHHRFSQLHKKDPFSRRYMTWLVHHEFGADHRPFRFDEKAPRLDDPNEAEYWLRAWVDAYKYILDYMPPEAVLVCYERLCGDHRDSVWTQIAERIKLLPYEDSLIFSNTVHEITYAFPPDLLEQAKKLYIELCNKAVDHV